MTTRINQFNISNTATPIVASLTATGNIVANSFLFANGQPVTSSSSSNGAPGNTLANTYKEVTTAYTAAAGEKLFVDCSAAPVTITLPESPTLGTEVTIIDATGSSNTNNITVARNGSKILGVDVNFIIDINESAITLAYYNTARGWILVAK